MLLLTQAWLPPPPHSICSSLLLWWNENFIFFIKTLTQINISKWTRSNLSNEFIFTCHNKMWFITTWNRIIRRLSWHSENISLDSLSQKIGSPTRIHIFMIQNSIKLSHIYSLKMIHQLSSGMKWVIMNHFKYSSNWPFWNKFNFILLILVQVWIPNVKN